MPHIPQVHKPNLPHREKPRNVTFFLDAPPLGSRAKLRRELLLMSSCTSPWAVRQESMCAQSLPFSCCMSWWQILAQREKWQNTSYILVGTWIFNSNHPKSNMDLKFPAQLPWLTHPEYYYDIAITISLKNYINQAPGDNWLSKSVMRNQWDPFQKNFQDVCSFLL